MSARRAVRSTLATSPTRRRTVSLLPLALLLLLLSTGGLPTRERAAAQQPAQPPAMQPLDPAAVNRAIDAGVRFLRQSQHPQGHWGSGTGPGSDKGWAVGYTCLAGLTLVECGVPTSDPGLQLARRGIRDYASKGELDSTYEVSLAILFLDRMKEKSDKPIVQMLAVRLIAGQTTTGGWGYKLPKYSVTESTYLLNAIRKLSPPQPVPPPSPRERPGSLGLCIKASDDMFIRPPPPFDPEKARKNAIDSVPVSMKKLPVLQNPDTLILEDPKDKRNETFNATTDNSNTHFAILGLWAARHHDVPTDRSFTLLAQRFRTSQGPNGTWAYDYVRNGANGSPQFTCIALLGLAIGHVLEPEAGVQPEKDPKIVNAFAALSGRIGEPAGRFDNRPTVKQAGGFYFLWAMERIAVLYDVRQLDKKDWYRWGAEILIGHQSQDGSWAKDDSYPSDHPVLNTCFALLFLKRANLTPDLSRRLTVDTAALTAKVDDKVSPKPVVTPPIKTPEPTPVVNEPPPRPRDVPPPPKVETPAPPPPQATAPAPAPEKKSNSWIWIVLLVLLALAGGGIAFFAVRRGKKDDDDDDDEDEEEERPKKKKKRKKARAEDD